MADVRSLTSFLLVFVSGRAARARAWKAFSQILRLAANGGQLTLAPVLHFLAGWLIPRSVFEYLRALDGQFQEGEVAPRPNALRS